MRYVSTPYCVSLMFSAGYHIFIESFRPAASHTCNSEVKPEKKAFSQDFYYITYIRLNV